MVAADMAEVQAEAMESAVAEDMAQGDALGSKPGRRWRKARGPKPNMKQVAA